MKLLTNMFVLIVLSLTILIGVVGCEKKAAKSQPTKDQVSNEHPDHPTNGKASSEHPDHPTDGKASIEHPEHPSKESGKSEHPEHPSNDSPTDDN